MQQVCSSQCFCAFPVTKLSNSLAVVSNSAWACATLCKTPACGYNTTVHCLLHKQEDRQGLMWTFFPPSDTQRWCSVIYLHDWRENDSFDQNCPALRFYVTNFESLSEAVRCAHVRMLLWSGGGYFLVILHFLLRFICINNGTLLCSSWDLSVLIWLCHTSDLWSLIADA